MEDINERTEFVDKLYRTNSDKEAIKLMDDNNIAGAFRTYCLGLLRNWRSS